MKHKKDMTMHVIFLPKDTNPYQELLQQALEKYGVAVSYQMIFPSGRWLIQHRRQSIILHLHWPHALYHAERHFIHFFKKLLLARMLGYKLVWTMHNFMPHSPSSPRFIDFLGRIALVCFSHAIIVHCKHGQELLRRKFYRKKHINIIPIGNYCYCYPYTYSREETRQQFRINPDHFVYLFVGNILPYKGVPHLVQTFLELDLPDTHLLIAGTCADSDLQNELEELTRLHPRITTLLKFISDQELRQLFALADVFVAPFSHILTSSSIILALSLGVPVIVPHMGCLPELITPEIGILYSPQQEQGLLQALQTIRMRDVKAMGEQAIHVMRSDKFNWDNIALKTWQVYQQT
jgi:beta-1,4-mannosyltransferase